MSAQPEALRLADKFEIDGFMGDHRFAQNQWCTQAAMELRRLHHENADLCAQLEAIGAGGVEPLRPRPGHSEDDLEMLAADAARYRWLRDESCAEGLNGQELDAAIDAAIQAKRAAAGQTDRKELA